MESHKARSQRVMKSADPATRQHIQARNRARNIALGCFVGLSLVVIVLLLTKAVPVAILVICLCALGVAAAVVEYMARDTVTRQDNWQQVFQKKPRQQQAPAERDPQ